MSPALMSAPTPGPDYRLAPRDLVEVQLFNQADVHTAQRLTANGEIRLPLVGRVSLEGLTVREAEERIEKLFQNGGYYVDPQVIVSVQQYADQFIAVFGQVRNPGRIPLLAEINSLGILDVITQAGGFTRIARTDAVQITRTGTGPNGENERFVVNVQELLDSRRPGESSEFQLLAGDVVFVPERAF